MGDDVGVRARELAKSYGSKEAVRRISLEVRLRALYGFLGPNGAGKPTTIGIPTSIVHPSRGVAQVAGVDVIENALGTERLKRLDWEL